MKFCKYTSIENSYRTAFINKIIDNGLSGGEWCVTEKVHGANYSFWINSGGIRVAKRTSFLGADTDNLADFFNHKIVVDKYEETLKHWYKKYASDNNLTSNETIIIYGELFGGNYPHKDVEKNSNVKAIQKGIWYNNDIDFYPFDIAIKEDDTGIKRYLDYNIACDIFKSLGFTAYADILFKGTMHECLEYNNAFNTTIPSKYGLPEIETNICEGTICRPIKSVCIGMSRVILKNKNKKFSEVNGSKYKEPKVVKELSDEVKNIIESISTYINENRLHNVLSKIGQVTNKDFGKINSLFSKDVIEDYTKDNPGIFDNLDKFSKKAVTKALGNLTSQLIRTNFLNIIDGDF